ncbi:MAG: T9SS type A sorting domain-containing protein [Bacteroidales bacterium]|nr:T9SS type A sorting domain-containing protein [Bacteroidales bacterium]MBK9358071.1 T9SS type A sorting domain-containing protein [Bacteroidales bacterium]
MTKRLFIIAIGLLIAIPFTFGQKPKKQMYMPAAPVQEKYKVDTRIDNMSYWRRMASLGLVPVAPDYKAKPGKYTGSKLSGRSVSTEDSPDVPVTTESSTQSENSIFVNPNNNQALLQSNNSTPNPVSGIYGANSFLSTDAGSSWGGSVQGAGGENSGDPATAIGLNGWYYVGYIHSSGGQGISYSTDQGQTWTPVLVAPSPGGWGSLLDKNHMWIDNSPGSPYSGYLYDAWTDFGGSNDAQIEINRSTDQGLTWSTPVNISAAVNAGSHNQGVNISTGPDGEVYAAWAIYDGWPTDESAIGMAKSLDGGATWQPSTRILSDIRGIRTSGTGKSMRVNSFPSMTVDISSGANRGNIYITWANIGTPGINTGSDIDIYFIKSTDHGATWSTPSKINQDAAGLGKQHYFPWITCDPSNGNLSVIYYDDRNVSSSECEVYVSTSTDGGFTWEDIKVSDVSFTPSSIPGLADSYFGDYLAISANNRWVYPAWTDNRSGTAMTYVSPFQAGPPPNQPWIIHNTHDINDATGNNNGLADFGENLEFNVTMENIGDQPATAVDVTLSSDSPFVTITDNTEPFGNFAVGEIKSIPSAFAIQISSEIPDGEALVFTLTATDSDDSTFVSNFMVEAHAPALLAGGISINDAAGNGNGRLDPGESAILSISTFNPGDYNADNTTAQLNSPSQFITITNPDVTLGNILPGQVNAVSAQFDIQVAPETPVGHSASFNYTAVSQSLTASKTFGIPVGLILEDWESGGYGNFEWEFTGTAPWNIVTDQVFEGENSSKSGIISDYETSEMFVTYNVMNEDSISFYWKVSSEATYDYLRFYIDNQMLDQISGEVDWTRVAFAITPGEHSLRWNYSKDVSLNVGDDAGWVDFIVFPAPLQTTAYAGPDAGSCEGASVLINGNATNYSSVSWTTSGDGSFEDSGSLSTFYTPGSNDIMNGTIGLTLTVNGLDGQVLSDNMTLSIVAPATVSAGSDVVACSNTEGIELTGTGSGYTAVQWMTTGTGTFSSPGSITTVYFPSQEDISNGMVTLTIIGVSPSPCSDVMDAKMVQFTAAPSATISGSADICSGSELTISVDLTGTAPWSLEVNNGVGLLTANETPFAFQVHPEVNSDYQVLSVTDVSDCQSAGLGIFNVTTIPSPQISLVADTSACANHTVVLTANTTEEVDFLWMPGASVNQSITIDSVGFGLGSHTWTVTATGANNCATVASTNLTFVDCTGIDDVANSKVSVYPNPSAGHFSLITAKEIKGIYRLDILDASNKVVYTTDNLGLGQGSKVNINAGLLADGLYLIQLTGSSATYSTKLIIRN